MGEVYHKPSAPTPRIGHCATALTRALATRSHQGKMLVVGAVEIEDGSGGPGRIRLNQVTDYSAHAIGAGIPGPTISLGGGTGGEVDVGGVWLHP